MSAPAWARVVLDDLGLNRWEVVWATRKWSGSQGLLGLCQSEAVGRSITPQRIIVASSMGVYEQLFTLLHEAAHAMGGKAVGHTRPWARRFVRLAVGFGYSLDYIAEREWAPVFNGKARDLPWCHPAGPCSCNWLERNHASKVRVLRRFSGGGVDPDYGAGSTGSPLSARARPSATAPT